MIGLGSDKKLILNSRSRYRGIVVIEIVDFTLKIQGNSCYTGQLSSKMLP